MGNIAVLSAREEKRENATGGHLWQQEGSLKKNYPAEVIMI